MAERSISKDDAALTLTAVADVDATADRAWQFWADPRQLERWWGPPDWPATFDHHEFEVNGRSRYHMTGPEGETLRGWWRITAIDAPRRLELEDGLADERGQLFDGADPMRVTVTFEPAGPRTRMRVVINFMSKEQFQQKLDWGILEGLRDSVGQIDDLLDGSRRARR